MIWLLRAAAGAAFVYQLIALIACIRQALRKDPQPKHLPPISVMKPVRGLDAQLATALDTHLHQAYPQYELLVGSADPDDPALRAAAAIGATPVLSHTRAANGKVGTMIDLNAAARFPVRVVNDGDIAVPPDYLSILAGGLEQPGVGVVTCLYRANAFDNPGRWEALGIATDFAPSVLVAPLFGINEFAMGSTMAFTAEDLQGIGGFEPIGPYVADDYQLGKRICALGKKVWLTRMVVETEVGGESWSGIWRHQVRWARTIRLSRGAYIGLPITNAALWSILLLLAGDAWFAVGLLVLRYITGLTGGLAVLRCPITRKLWPLMPLRDLWAFGVWIAGMTGDRIEWRGLHIRMDRTGRIIESR